MPFGHDNSTAKICEHKTVAPQSGGRIRHPKIFPFTDPYRAAQQFVLAATPAVPHAAAAKIHLQR